MTAFAFYKMHGLGNDFVVINGISQNIDVKKIPIPQLAHRHTGIGFDQLLLILPSTQADVFCKIFNADGSEAEQCGNGMRCIARFIHEQKLTEKKSIRIETKSGVVHALIHDYDTIQIEMQTPIFSAEKSPSAELIILSMGNPHAILQVDSVKDAPVTTEGSRIATHAIFPQGINVGFMEIVNPKHIRLRTFERGVGETLACGSNACAAVAAGIQHYSLDSKVKVELALGNLWIEWPKKTGPILLTGPASNVFMGKTEF